MSFGNIKFNLWPQAKAKAFTLSYDDGVIDDRRFIEVINGYQLKSTFHVNSGLWGGGNRLNEAEVKDLYQGHEVSLHSVSHPMIANLPQSLQCSEVVEDKRRLEALVGYPIRGMSYPFGSYNSDLLSTLKTLGVKYSRTTLSTKKNEIPEDFLEWHPTCHHHDALECVDEFLGDSRHGTPQLFYVWGHTYEFPIDDNWDLIDRLADKVAGREDVWYATNIEIFDYCTAVKGLEFSVEADFVFNPSCHDVWVTFKGEPKCLPSGKVTSLA